MRYDVSKKNKIHRYIVQESTFFMPFSCRTFTLMFRYRIQHPFSMAFVQWRWEFDYGTIEFENVTQF